MISMYYVILILSISPLRGGQLRLDYHYDADAPKCRRYPNDCSHLVVPANMHA